MKGGREHESGLMFPVPYRFREGMLENGQPFSIPSHNPNICRGERVDFVDFVWM
jgi:hypothetical protein